MAADGEEMLSWALDVVATRACDVVVGAGAEPLHAVGRRPFTRSCRSAARGWSPPIHSVALIARVVPRSARKHANQREPLTTRRLQVVPLLDCFNHACGARGRVALDDDGETITLTLRAAVRAGDEICVSYGAVSHSQLLTRYGFCPGGGGWGVYDRVALEIGGEPFRLGAAGAALISPSAARLVECARRASASAEAAANGTTTTAADAVDDERAAAREIARAARAAARALWPATSADDDARALLRRDGCGDDDANVALEGAVVRCRHGQRRLYARFAEELEGFAERGQAGRDLASHLQVLSLHGLVDDFEAASAAASLKALS